MKNIEIFDRAIAEQDEREIIERGIDYYALYRAYKESIEGGNDCFNFFQPVWDYQFDGISDFFREHDINEFTISCRSTDILEWASGFEARGFKVAGTTKVYYQPKWGLGNLEKREQQTALRFVR